MGNHLIIERENLAKSYPADGKRWQVVINGRDNRQLTDEDLALVRNKTVGFIFHFASLIPTLTVLENILLPLSFSKTSNGDRQAALDLLEKVGLLEKVNSLPGQLSGEQQRRVAIDRAFINRPEILLADEPTGDLDEETEQEIFELFSSDNREHGTTFLIVTHNKELAIKNPRARVFTMRQGEIVEERHG